MERFQQAIPDIAISSLVWGELLYGARASTRVEQNLTNLFRFIQVVPVVNYDEACAESYSHIRVALRQMGRPTGEVDALIASVAITYDATLVTNNTRHFQHIPNLKLTDWLA
jgi:tRNA(fMet)-specific endonuclease VapC